MTFWSIFPIFSWKQVLTFHANCLLGKQFAWNAKDCPGKNISNCHLLKIQTTKGRYFFLYPEKWASQCFQNMLKINFQRNVNHVFWGVKKKYILNCLLRVSYCTRWNNLITADRPSGWSIWSRCWRCRVWAKLRPLTEKLYSHPAMNRHLVVTLRQEKKMTGPPLFPQLLPKTRARLFKASLA